MSATPLAMPKRRPTARMARLVGSAAHHRHHDEDEHELPAYEQGQREEVQEADERPGVHAGGYSSSGGRRRRRVEARVELPLLEADVPAQQVPERLKAPRVGHAGAQQPRLGAQLLVLGPYALGQRRVDASDGRQELGLLADQVLPAEVVEELEEGAGEAGCGLRGRVEQRVRDQQRTLVLRTQMVQAVLRRHRGETPLRPAAASAVPRNGASRSSGSGKTIVEFWSAPISSSVCR